MILSCDGMITWPALTSEMLPVHKRLSPHTNMILCSLPEPPSVQDAHTGMCVRRGKGEREIEPEWHFQVIDSVPKIESSLGYTL